MRRYDGSKGVRMKALRCFHQFPDVLSNHLMCHIARRNFRNFLPYPLNTSPPKVQLDAYTFLFSAVHLGMQLNTGQDKVEVAHYKPGEEAGDKLIMETGHLSDLLRGKLCPILTPSPILHPAGPYLLAVQVFLSSTIHTFVLL